MDGVKVTYIETSFVTSDVAGFKDLVQRLTGRSPAVAPHRPPQRSCRVGADDCWRTASAAAGPQGCYHASPPAAHEAPFGDGRIAPPCPELDETYGVADFSDVLLYGSASQTAQYGHGGYYSDFFSC